MADSTNVTIANPPATTGTFFRAPLGTALPADATTALVAAYEDHGFVGEEGYQYEAARSITDHKAFGGDTVATSQDSYDWTLTVTLIEDKNAEVLKTVFGDDNVDDTDPDAIKVTHNKARQPRSVFAIDTISEGDAVKRFVLPVGQVVSVGPVTLVHTELIKYTLTIKAYPNPTGDNVFEYNSAA